MARKRVKSNEDRPAPAVSPEPSTESEDELEDREARRRYREMFWFPVLDLATERALRSAEGGPAEVSRVLPDAAEAGASDERFAAVVSALGRLLSGRDQTVRRAAARLLADVISTLTESGMWAGPSTPGDLDPVLPALLAATAVPDSETRMSLLQALGRLASRDCASRILPPVTEHCFKDSASEVVVEAIGVVMATGVDLASAAIPDIVGLLGHQDAQVRLAVCDALARFGVEAGEAVTLLLRVALSDADASLREHAALALAAVDPEGRRTSRELTDHAERQTFLSLLRSAGPTARELRVRLVGLWNTADAAPSRQPSVPEAAHSPDFSSVDWFGTEYTFSTNQAKCVAVLWECWQNRTPQVSGAYILEAADLEGLRLKLVFRNNPAWDTMIVPGNKKGTYRLNPPRRD